jgi:1,4-dihydroxy-2-naphthoate octaprenyltransferase
VTGEVRDKHAAGGLSQGSPGLLHFAGFLHVAGVRCWTASVLPALVGTTLPFWLRPAGFAFRWLAAIEFLIATVLLHAGFSFLHARFEGRSTAGWPGSRLLGVAGACLVAGCLLGLHLNSGLTLHVGVPGSIFIVYGLSALFAGVLYVAPPFLFCRRLGGEVVLSVGLGLVPVLGGYLVQVGDITRKVYVAALPLVVATALWVWIDELITRAGDEKGGRDTMVILFGPRFSGRVVVPALSLVLGATLFVAAFTASIPPWALAVALSFGLVWGIVAVCWTEHADSARLLETREKAFTLHLATGIILAASSLVALRS